VRYVIASPEHAYTRDDAVEMAGGWYCWMLPQSLTQNINDSSNYFVYFLLFEASGLIQYDVTICCKNTIWSDMTPLFKSSGHKIIFIN